MQYKIRYYCIDIPVHGRDDTWEEWDRGRPISHSILQHWGNLECSNKNRREEKGQHDSDNEEIGGITK